LGLLAALHPALLLVPLFGIPGVLFGAAGARITQRAYDETAEELRFSALLFDIATGPVPGKEVRIFGLAPELRGRLADRQRHTLESLTRARLRAATLTTLGSLIFAVAYVAAVALVAWQVIEGRATLGDLTLAVAAVATVSNLVSAAVTQVSWLSGTLRMINRFIWMVDYAAEARPTIADPADVPDRIAEGITIDGVSFTYPGTDIEVLHEVNLQLPAGSTVAVVGDNGAGKTTLVKLLCRFYEPTTGVIALDGVDIARFDHESWRGRISAGFQDFAAFELLARETVGVGDLASIGSDDAVLGALDRANAADVLTSLPTGLDTQLGRSFDGGVDLSTGQWQKLALGRALMRETPLLLVLDEPTASLDAQTEHALFERYATSASAVASQTGAITVLVSHRFSTVRMADLILVVNDGRLVESGTHDELMAMAGSYAELFEIQASAYR
jgi:ATP-binding cassette subfamily B protein